MANLSIPSIRERLFNTSKHESVTQRSTNPFAASTFKGNVLTADVFESSTKKEPAFTGKLKSSALVGSISGIGEKFQNMINSVIAFSNRIKESVVNSWNKLEGIEISLNPLKERMSSAYDSVKEMLKTPMSEFMYSGVSVKSVAKMDDMTAARNLLADNVRAWETTV